MIETQHWPPPGVALQVYPWTTKINPIWWFQNDEGIDPSYQPDWPHWKRAIYWWFRNPMWNFFKYVVGVEDRELTVTGTAPVFLPYWEGGPQEGQSPFKWSVIRTGWLILPFVSYSSAHTTLYAGWMPSGGRLGIKINFR